MKAEAGSFDIKDRICILTFDEMSINSKFVVDSTTKQIISSSKVQVVLARGIYGGWKQPIYYQFDAPMTSETLEKIIIRMEKAGYPVHGVCSDLGGDNRGVQNSWNIDVGKSSFRNPVDEERVVHVFSDVPHMLKLLRNHLLDDGVMFENGSIINRKTFEKLVEFDNTAVKLCPKLSMRLLNVSGPERMRVRPAAQLLSHHVSCLASRAFPEKPYIADFIRIVNNGFDVMNSRVPVEDKNAIRSGFGVHMEEQKTALLELREVLLSCRFFLKSGNLRRVLLPFQKGLIVSIDSTLALWKDLNKLYSLDFILTSRLNQDSLESLFSRIRAFGGPNTNPTPPEFKYRLRLLLLGSKVRSPDGANTNETFENCNWISAKLLQQSHLGPKTSTPNVPDTPGIVSIQKANYDAVMYLAGYLAFKLKKRGYKFGTPTNGDIGSSWIHTLSRGGLLLPSELFCNWITACNDSFEKHSTILGEPNAYMLMIGLVKNDNPGVDDVIIKEFVSTRLNIQVNHMNNSHRNLNSYKKKLRQVVNSRKRK